MVRSLDDGVGNLLKAVDEAGIADRTIIVFFFIASVAAAMMRIFRIGVHFLLGWGPRPGWPGGSAKPTAQVRAPKPDVAYRNFDGAHVTRVTNARITGT